MRGLARGAADLGDGLRFLAAHPRLWGWLIAPAVVTLALSLVAIWGIASCASPLVDWATTWMPASIEPWARGVTWIVVVIALGLAAALVFVPVAGAVAGPWNELLSAAVESRVTGTPSPPFSWRGLVRDLATSVVHGARRVAVAVLAAIAVLAISLVPVIGTVAAAALGAWFTARGAAYDAYDAALARRELSYQAKLGFLAQHRGRTLGLGAAVSALLFVPFVNLLAFGMGATAATLAVLELESATRAASGAATR